MTTPTQIDSLVSDPWAPLSHKRAMRECEDRGRAVHRPWFFADARRLTAYRILQDYQDNQARQHLDTLDATIKADHREYGDAALIVNQALAGLLGEEQSITVEGADDYDANLPAVGAEGSDTTTEQWQINAEAFLALQRQEWLRQWAVDSRFWLKMSSNERKAVGLGDAVYVFGWTRRKGRVDVKTYDPGFYFPDLDTTETSDEDFPTRIHIAFETDPDPSTLQPRKLRRITWELAPIPFASQTVINDDGRYDRETLFDDDAMTTPSLQQGDRVERETGRVVRAYPWLVDGEVSGETCLMTDAQWDIADVRGTSVYDLTYEKADFRLNADGEVIRRLDLGFDFLPIVHIPNTIAEEEHYGRSTLATILQILDDLAATDTDLSKAAATTGSPPLALKNAEMGKGQRRTYGPGEIFETGDGTMTVLDTSRALDALLKLLEALFSRLSTNSRIPESVLGRVKPSEVPSGVALALSFGPMQSMVREMRQIRDEKYPIIFRIVQRIAQVGLLKDGKPGLERGASFDSRIAFGSYLPADKAAAVDQVTKLLEKRAISRLTGVSMLVDAGFAIDDAVSEVERITHEDFEGAVQLFEALGSTEAVQEYLGREHAPDAATEPVDAGAGGTGVGTAADVEAELGDGQRGSATAPAVTG